jgi:hypothetical protein
MMNGNGLPMRPLLVFALLLLAACTQSSASRVDERTFRVESPPMAIGGEAANRHLANRLCPKGFYVVDTRTQKGGPDRATDEQNPMEIWTIRCI